MTDATGAGIALTFTQRLAVAGQDVAALPVDDVGTDTGDNELVASDETLVCARCDRSIVTGQPIRRRATGGWQHEEC